MIDMWDEDPMPVPPGAPESAERWRWLSARTLAADPADVECEDGCDCVSCQNAAERAYTSRHESGLTAGERSRLEQESLVRARRLK